MSRARRAATHCRALLLLVLPLPTSAGWLDAQAPYETADVRGLESFLGSDAARTRLLQQGFVVATEPKPLRQLFSAYVDSRLPPFVTVDLLLDAYAVQLERFVIAVDRRQPANLRRFSQRLEVVARSIDGPLGPRIAAFATLAKELQAGEPSDDHAVAALRARLQHGTALLAGMQPLPAAALEPQGTYADEPELAGYFRARRLYQLAVPTNLRAGQLLAAAFTQCAADPELQRVRRLLQAPSVELLGPPLADGLLPGCWTPMHELQQRLRRLSLRQCEGTALPMLAVGPLASPAGVRLCAAAGMPGLDQQLEAVAAPATHFGRWLQALALLQQPDPRAPALFHTNAWADLQANTQLAAWAESRHTWVLQAQLHMTRLLRGDTDHGRVAPCPHAFAALAQLAEELRIAWQREIETRDLAVLQAGLRQDLALAHALLDDVAPRPRLATADARRGEALVNLLWDLLDAEVPAVDTEQALLLRADATCATAPEQLPVAARGLLLRLCRGQFDVDLQSLAAVAQRLAAIAETELAAREHGDGDDTFLAELGQAIARLHGYRSNSYLHPADDHPRVTTVGGVDPGIGSPRFLQVGTARPEALYVILEIAGQPVLHRGAVLAYRESMDSAPTTDAAWRTRLDRSDAPTPLPFTRSFRIDR